MGKQFKNLYAIVCWVRNNTDVGLIAVNATYVKFSNCLYMYMSIKFTMFYRLL